MFFLIRSALTQLPYQTDRQGDADLMNCRCHADMSFRSWCDSSLRTTLNIQSQQLFIKLISYTLDSIYNLFLPLMRHILSGESWSVNVILKIYWAGITPDITCFSHLMPPPQKWTNQRDEKSTQRFWRAAGRRGHRDYLKVPRGGKKPKWVAEKRYN